MIAGTLSAADVPLRPEASVVLYLVSPDYALRAGGPYEYTLDRELNFQWLNPVLAYLVPQRTTLLGFSLALIVLLLVWTATRESLTWPAYLFAGVVAGLMPAFHVHAWGTVVALSAFWFLFTRRREWIAFFVPAVALALPVLVWMWPPANNSFCGDGGSILSDSPGKAKGECGQQRDVQSHKREGGKLDRHEIVQAAHFEKDFVDHINQGRLIIVAASKR